VLNAITALLAPLARTRSYRTSYSYVRDAVSDTIRVILARGRVLAWWLTPLLPLAAATSFWLTPTSIVRGIAWLAIGMRLTLRDGGR